MTLTSGAGGDPASVTLFLCGDVMTGRGIDQLLAVPGNPELREPFLRDAREYVQLAERQSGPISAPVEPAYPWGDALEELDRGHPDVRLINLETSLTRSGAFAPGKEIHYRMEPANIGCLTAARIDACCLANNHVLDLGVPGLLETLRTLEGAGIPCCGAGADLSRARQPARIRLPAGGAVLFFGLGTESSGIPPSWAAGERRPGVELLPGLSETTAATVAARIRAARGPGELAVASIHWGTNWGYEIPDEQVRFARWLVDGGVDLVHGHSSHHPRPLEVYKEKLVLYGCGDFINDYEGITGYEDFRSDLRLIYLATLDSTTGALRRLRLVPLRSRALTLRRAAPSDARWLGETLTRVSERFGTRVVPSGEAGLLLEWNPA